MTRERTEAALTAFGDSRESGEPDGTTCVLRKMECLAAIDAELAAAVAREREAIARIVEGEDIIPGHDYYHGNPSRPQIAAAIRTRASS